MVKYIRFTGSKTPKGGAKDHPSVHDTLEEAQRQTPSNEWEHIAEMDTERNTMRIVAYRWWGMEKGMWFTSEDFPTSTV